MRSVSSAELPIELAGGGTAGVFTVALRPRAQTGQRVEPLWDLRGEASPELGEAPVQLLEGHEYLYRVEAHHPTGSLSLSPSELFDPDSADCSHGRLRPGAYTGTIVVSVASGAQQLGELRLEVRSRKLGYLDDYRWMLSALANDAAEVLMQRFSPAELQRFVPEFAKDARTLYQRFAFLNSVLRGGNLEAALHEVLGRPHHEFVRESQLHPPQRGVRMAADIGRQLTGPGPRVPCPGRPAHFGLRALPRQLRSQTTEPTVDTEANRFVRFALEHWRGTVLRLGEALRTQAERSASGGAKPSAPLERGLREIASALDFVDSHLGEEIFREIAPLRQFPMANQVLERREGYREIYRSFIASEAASRLRWEGGEDVYGAGQRDGNGCMPRWWNSYCRTLHLTMPASCITQSERIGHRSSSPMRQTRSPTRPPGIRCARLRHSPAPPWSTVISSNRHRRLRCRLSWPAISGTLTDQKRPGRR